MEVRKTRECMKRDNNMDKKMTEGAKNKLRGGIGKKLTERKLNIRRKRKKRKRKMKKRKKGSKKGKMKM